MRTFAALVLCVATLGSFTDLAYASCSINDGIAFGGIKWQLPTGKSAAPGINYGKLTEHNWANRARSARVDGGCILYLWKSPTGKGPRLDLYEDASSLGNWDRRASLAKCVCPTR